MPGNNTNARLKAHHAVKKDRPPRSQSGADGRAAREESMPSENGIAKFSQIKEATATRTKDVSHDLRIDLQELRWHEALAVFIASLAGTGARPIGLSSGRCRKQSHLRCRCLHASHAIRLNDRARQQTSRYRHSACMSIRPVLSTVLATGLQPRKNPPHRAPSARSNQQHRLREWERGGVP